MLRNVKLPPPAAIRYLAASIGLILVAFIDRASVSRIAATARLYWA